MDRTLLALHAHPDDESSKGAATVARFADEGVRCVLVTATGGEAGDILNPAMDRPGVAENLTEIRRRELMDAASIIGYNRVEMLGYRDSGMPGSPDNSRSDAFVNAGFDEVLGRIVATVREERPGVVLGYDDHEWYPHPDHLRIHDLSLAVFEAAADPERFPDTGPPWEVANLYAPVLTARHMYRLHDAMVAAGLDSPFTRWTDNIPRNADDDRKLVQVEVGAQLERARDALRAHRTQVDPDGFWFQVPVEVVRAVYPYEDFELLATRSSDAVEADGDLFAGADVPRLL